MTIANDIINRQMPDFDFYLRQDETLDDMDEYGFTPLIETVITGQMDIAARLIERGVDVNKPDVTGRTPLHWAVDNNDLDFVRFLLEHKANPNAYTRNGLSILVFPILREQDQLKNLLYKHGAKVDFPLDFIYGKLIGHRFELEGTVDILTTEGVFIELDYEGFILEFTVAIIQDSLRRFITSYSTRNLRSHFPMLYPIMDGFAVASEMLRWQKQQKLTDAQIQRLNNYLREPLLILPAASRGHAFSFIRYQHWWVKIDRGENSLKEGSVNIYNITKPEALNAKFIQNFLYKRQSRRFFHNTINQILGLKQITQFPMSSQIAGNCSWANIQAIIPVAYALLAMKKIEKIDTEAALNLYNAWLEWDQDRALSECMQRFYLADPARKATFASMLAAVLFQRCHHGNPRDLERAEKILAILTLPDYYYILQSYLEVYCVKRLTDRGNNLLKILDDCGINPNIGVNPIATELPKR